MINKSIFTTVKTKDFDPFTLTSTFKDELSALKKVNQFGKKLSDDGEYVMYHGMIFGIQKFENGSNNSLSVGFIDPKLMNILSPLLLYPIRIKGIEFYQLTSNGSFIGYELFANRIELYFEKEETVTEEFEIEKFITYAKSKGFTDFEVVVAYKKGWETNMDVYNLYLKYLQTLGTYNRMVKHTLILQYVSPDHDKILKKACSIVEEISQGVLICEKELDTDEMSRFMNSEEPTEYILPKMCGTGTEFLRLMKNVYITLSTSSHIGFRVVETSDKYHFLITGVETSGNLICNIFKIQPIDAEY